MKKLKFLILFLVPIFVFLGYAEAESYRYYMLTVTSYGWNGAEFGAGFSGFSGQDASGTNIFSSYGSLTSESGWIWDGYTASNLFNFSAGARPYIYSGSAKWMKFQLDQAREIGSFKIGNYISEGDRWWITGIKIEASHDAVNYISLYSGAVSTSQVYSVFNIVHTPVPEPASLFLLGIFISIFSMMIRYRT